MSKIKVDTNRMKSDIESIEECVDGISHCYMDLIQCEVRLNKMWDGVASDTFSKEYKKDLVDLMTMISNLTKMSNYVDMAKKSYQDCETMISSVISDI